MNVLSVNFWVSTLASTFITLVCIYLIKKAAGAINIPVVNEIAQAV